MLMSRGASLRAEGQVQEELEIAAEAHVPHPPHACPTQLLLMSASASPLPGQWEPGKMEAPSMGTPGCSSRQQKPSAGECMPQSPPLRWHSSEAALPSCCPGDFL